MTMQITINIVTNQNIYLESYNFLEIRYIFVY